MYPKSKKKYHPLIIILYHNGMLTHEQLKKIPRSTRHNWNDFKNEDYYGYDIIAPYIKQLDNIKNVYISTHTRRTIEFLLHTRNGYYEMLGELQHHTHLMKLHADKIVGAIDHMRNKTRMTARKACKIYGISKDWYYTEKRRIRCTLSPIGRCYNRHTNQLTHAEIKTIEDLVSDAKNHCKSLSTIYYHYMRNKTICFGKSTFYKYVKALGYTRSKLKHKKVRKKGFVASYPFEWLHIDITYINTLRDGVQKVAFVKDNYSSALLHVKTTSGKAGSHFIAQLLQEAFDKHGLCNKQLPINILSDGGPENKGEVFTWIKNIEAPPTVKKITALSEEFPYSNAMSESTHHIYKSIFMQKKLSATKEEHLIHLQEFMNYYNYYRYPCRLYGRTPIEVLQGQKIDRQLFSKDIQERKEQRITENKSFEQCFQKLGCTP